MKVGFIGCGNMGSALASAAAKRASAVYLYDKRSEAARALAARVGGMVTDCELTLCKAVDVIFLAVKPSVLPEVLNKLGNEGVPDGKLIVSMAAGVTIKKIEEALPHAQIIRIMPNTPVAVGAGMILWCKNEAVTAEACNVFMKITSYAGELMEIDEGLIDAATAVSGCGPAFVYGFIDAMAKGGESAGLTLSDARRLAAITAIGAARMLLESDKEPSELIAAVCSPGGSTIEGVNTLREGGLEKLVSDAVSASYRRTVELGK